MAIREDLTWQKFGEWTVIEELGGGKVTCQCSCGTVKILYKKAVKEGKTKSCGCLKSAAPQIRDDLTDKQFGSWTVLKELGGGKVLCRCSCGTEREVYKQALKEGRSTSCGCSYIGKPKTEVEIGTTFGALTVTKQLMGGKVICRCSCGSEKEYYLHNLLNGTTKTCGHNKLQNTEGQQFGYWTVIKELGYGKVLCKCECGTEKELYKKTLKEGRSKSCGCKSLENSAITYKNKIADEFTQYKGKTINDWTIKEQVDNTHWLCECSCGTIRVLDKQSVIKEKSKSCGCKQQEYSIKTYMELYGDTHSRANNPREQWQIDAVKSKENIIKFITSNYKEAPTINELASTLDISDGYLISLSNKWEIKSYLNNRPSASSYERLLEDHLHSIIGDMYIEHNTRKVISPFELDLFISELNLAIEINGDYWHSDRFVDDTYHINKTRICKSKGIRLIHVFEYELKDNDKREKILNLLKDIIVQDNTIYARDTEVKEVDKETSKAFLNKYHLQSDAASSIRLGLFHKNELIQLITLGKPRFNKEYQYEIIRSCTKTGCRVIGGFSKLLSYIRNTYNPESIISYIDLSKFTGESYKKSGFTCIGVSNPNYVWVKNNIVLSRYQTQKHILVDKGLGRLDQTEDEIMKMHGYMKVYDCGNIKMLYKREENKDGDR